uniref:Uncharacterized protein n=1 Tax=Oryza rufipogon TaxID=4529 RepID=A0A0E0PQC8_ORYRU
MRRRRWATAAAAAVEEDGIATGIVAGGERGLEPRDVGPPSSETPLPKVPRFAERSTPLALRSHALARDVIIFFPQTLKSRIGPYVRGNKKRNYGQSMQTAKRRLPGSLSRARMALSFLSSSFTLLPIHPLLCSAIRSAATTNRRWCSDFQERDASKISRWSGGVEEVGREGEVSVGVEALKGSVTFASPRWLVAWPWSWENNGNKPSDSEIGEELTTNSVERRGGGVVFVLSLP